MPETPTMTQQQVYDIINLWGTAAADCYAQWKTLYNFLPPPPPAATTKWQAAGQIASVYTGPVIS